MAERRSTWCFNTKLIAYDYFYQIDSCIAELAWEECALRGLVGDAVILNMASCVTVITTVTLYLAFL